MALALLRLDGWDTSRHLFPTRATSPQLLLMTLDFSNIAFPLVSMHCHEQLSRISLSSALSHFKDILERRECKADCMDKLTMTISTAAWPDIRQDLGSCSPIQCQACLEKEGHENTKASLCYLVEIPNMPQLFFLQMPLYTCLSGVSWNMYIKTL